MARFARHLQNHTINNPFQGQVRLERSLGHPIEIRLGSNESQPLPNPALQALLGEQGMAIARHYPDPYAHALRERAARLNQVQPGQVVFDTGADSLILLSLRLCCDVGDCVVSSAGTYPAFRYFAEGCGLGIHEVPLSPAINDGFAADLAGLAEAAHQQQAKLVYLANPDNPTGYHYPQLQLEQLRQALPAGCMLLLDEAYLEFADTSAISYCLTNTIRLRTLSKAYALAGLRIGYAIAPEEIINKADQIRPQFALSSLAQAAASLALQAQDDVRLLIDRTIGWRQQLQQTLSARGLPVLPSATNFVSIVYPSAAHASQVQKRLFSQRIAVHRPPHPAVQQLIRVTVSPEALDPAVIDLLAEQG